MRKLVVRPFHRMVLEINEQDKITKIVVLPQNARIEIEHENGHAWVDVIQHFEVTKSWELKEVEVNQLIDDIEVVGTLVWSKA